MHKKAAKANADTAKTAEKEDTAEEVNNCAAPLVEETSSPCFNVFGLGDKQRDNEKEHGDDTKPGDEE